MGMIGFIPKHLLGADKKDEFLRYLRDKIPLPHTRKYMLLDWCDFTGVKMTRKLAEQADIPAQV